MSIAASQTRGHHSGRWGRRVTLVVQGHPKTQAQVCLTLTPTYPPSTSRTAHPCPPSPYPSCLPRGICRVPGPRCLSPSATSGGGHTWTCPSKGRTWLPAKPGSRRSPNADGSDVCVSSSRCGLSNPLRSNNHVKVSISETCLPLPTSPSPLSSPSPRYTSPLGGVLPRPPHRSPCLPLAP